MAKYDEYGLITELNENEVFVFGSNGQGAHLGGAAATAVRKFGAKMGQAEGLQGQSYAIKQVIVQSKLRHILRITLRTWFSQTFLLKYSSSLF